MKCYKVVTRTDDNRLLSAYADILPEGWVVEYIVGEPAHAEMMGKLFAFTTLEQARRLVHIRNAVRSQSSLLTVDIYDAIATNAISINTVLTIGAYEEDFEEFWTAGSRLHDLDLPFLQAPLHTILCDTITLIKRIT